MHYPGLYTAHVGCVQAGCHCVTEAVVMHCCFWLAGGVKEPHALLAACDAKWPHNHVAPGRDGGTAEGCHGI
jgi:hypothetical protein